jgi:Pyridoxamine 5'-phosphate oxidase
MSGVSWTEFAAAEPAMAQQGRALIYRRGDGEGLFVTVAGNGLPRVHPINVGVVDGRLVAFIQDKSAKARDLEADGRYALHAVYDPAQPHEFLVRGRAQRVTEPAIRQTTAGDWFFTVSDAYPLYELLIEHVVLGERATADDWPPQYRSWRAG